MTNRGAPSYNDGMILCWRAFRGGALSAVFAVCLMLLPPALSAKAGEPAAKGAGEKKAARMSAREYAALVGSVLEYVEKNYVEELDPETLYAGALKGMLDAVGDPYSAYLDPAMMRSLSDTADGQFGGVGLSISKPAESTPEKPAYVEVASPIEDTPGWRAGIQTGDRIVSIDGTPTESLTLEAVLGMLRGPAGEDVRLVVLRGKTAEFPLTLTRALIEVPCVKYGMIDGAGYIRIIEFTPRTAGRVQEALDSFKAAGYASLIVDVRNNPGGLLASVAAVADKFIDAGAIVSTKSRHAKENAVFSASPKKTAVPGEIPLAVLINRGSASASEILAGALKDSRRAYLVGERTYGKGSVQQPLPLRRGKDGVKLTVSRYYTPSGANIDKAGIPPDREIAQLDFSEEDEQAFTRLTNGRVIAEYVEAHPDMTEADISAYAAELGAAYAPLEARFLRRLVRLEARRTEPAPLYDLDYDVQLAETLRILRSENFPALVRATKTVKELQAEQVLPSAAE